MRILFIGNSHTFANGLPCQVREMVNSATGREECQSGMCAVGGRDLAWHAAEDATLLTLAGGPWDFVVLQQKTHPFAGYARLAADCDRLLPHVAGSGAQALLFATWKRRDAPESEQDALDAAFARFSRERRLRLVPIGAAWRQARRARPEIELYDADGAHASPAGTYLAACVFFRELTGRSPTGLPARIAADGAVLAELPGGQARALQEIAAAAEPAPWR